jgi:hypothetical protein
MSSTPANDRSPSRGQNSAAAAAANRKNAGAGMRRRSLTRLESTAPTPASAVTSTGTPKVAALIDLSALPGHRALAVSRSRWPGTMPRPVTFS